MFLINKIKYDASANYDIYEDRIKTYYNMFYMNEKNLFHKNNLTDYILQFMIQSNLSGVFYNTSISVLDVNKYMRNLYLSYYNYYIKNIISDGQDFIIKSEHIGKFIKNDKDLYNHTKTNIPLDEFIKNVFKKIYTLSSFERHSKITINCIFLYLSKLLDHIIEENITTVIISMAIDNQNQTI